MTNTLLTSDESRNPVNAIMVRIGIAIAALAIIAGFFALVALLWPSADALPATRHPFSAGLQEAAPKPAGIGGMILTIQSAFYARMISALQGLSHTASAAWGLIALSFAYGVFHAAGPGHGKAVISGYLIADGRRSLGRGLGLAFASSLLQAVTAVAIVGVLAVLLGATTGAINATAQLIEQMSFALIALVGLLMLWRKSARLGVLISTRQKADVDRFSDLAFQAAPQVQSGRFKADEVQANEATAACQHPLCQNDGCAHLLMPETVNTLANWREMAMVVLSAGLRPCTGAIIVLVFALTQGLLAAGIAAVFAMALGTFITVGVLASLAVFAKRFATKLATANSQKGVWAIAILEILASALIAVIGFTLAFGPLSGAS